jgi:branched-chain amino acid transport system permease protein
MASVPFTTSSFPAARFWGIRLLSIIAVLIGLWAIQTMVIPKLNGYDVRIMTLALLMATLAVSLNIINGITGQFSMGHAAFYVTGAYTSGKLTQLWLDKAHMNPQIWLSLMVLAGALAAAIAGFVVGLPSLRLKGDYLAIVTMGFGEIVRIFINNQDGGNSSIFGLDLGGSYQLNTHHKITEFWHIALLLIICIAISRNLLKTVHGLSFLSIREDELAANAVGVNTTMTKVVAFVLGGALAGAAGVLFAHFNQTIAPDDGAMAQSFLIVTMVVIGGMGSITGACIAGFCLSIVPEALRRFPPIGAIDLMSLVLGVIVVIVLSSQLAKRDVTASKGWQAFTTVLGYVFCAALLVAIFLNFKSTVSPIIKFIFIGVSLSAVVALLFTPAKVSLPKFGHFLLLVGIVLAIKFPLSAVFHKVSFIESNLAQTTYTPSDLRWALFAVSLIVVMLVRPAGLLGHYEWSWDLLARLFGRQYAKKEVSA